MKLKKIIFAVVAVLAVVVAAAVAFVVGRSQSDDAMREMQAEVDELRAMQYDAAITKRVSKQMEDIAYQQKEVSDIQRERAEEQSAIATAMRKRAEQESRAARDAEAKATRSAQEAERERINAINQERVAIEQRDRATLARNIADTLYCRTIAVTLGGVARTQYKNGQHELASQLAYASWHFLDKFNANTYPTNTYLALCETTNSVTTNKLHYNAAVNGLAPLDEGCIAVTGYGGIERVDRSGVYQLYQNKAYDFRDVVVDGGYAYALSYRGPLCRLSLNGNRMKVIDVPEESYFKILRLDNRTLLLAARRHLSWFDTEKAEVTRSMKLSGEISAVTKRGTKVSLCYRNGGYAEMDGTGEIKKVDLLYAKDITSAFYNPDNRCLYLALRTGNILVYNRYNRWIVTLVSHQSRPTDICARGNMLVSTAYDKCMQLWDLTRIYLDSGLSFEEDILCRDKCTQVNIDTNRVPVQWVSPAVVSTEDDSWALAVCIDSKNTVWHSTSSGYVYGHPLYAHEMAAELYKRVDNLTETEWKYYVGVSIPYTKFK